MRSENSFLISLLGEHPILYNPALAAITDSVVAGLFLSQLLYWKSRNPRKEETPFFYKTIEEMHQETRLKRSEQDRAIKILVSLKILEVKIMGTPPRRYFSVNSTTLVNELMKFYGIEIPMKRKCKFCKTWGRFPFTDEKDTYIHPHKKGCQYLIAETSN